MRNHVTSSITKVTATFGDIETGQLFRFQDDSKNFYMKISCKTYVLLNTGKTYATISLKEILPLPAGTSVTIQQGAPQFFSTPEPYDHDL